MAFYGFGYALYEPEQFERLMPGTLGYFDKDCRWHPIVNLTNGEAVVAMGYTPFNAPHLRTPDTRRWDPLSSSEVIGRNVNLEATVDGTDFGLPANVKVVTEYTTKSDFAAILMCDGDVIVQGYDVRGPFEQWIRDNRLALARVPELREHGVVCSTWTYSSRNVHLTVWQNSENTVNLGCTAGAHGIADASAGGTWFRGRSGSMWTDFMDMDRVVFFTGVKCKFTWLGSVKTEPEGNWLGGEKSVVWDSETEDAFECEIEAFGDEQ